MTDLKELQERLALWKWGGDAFKYIHGDSIEKPSPRAQTQLKEITELIEAYTKKKEIQARIDELGGVVNNYRTSVAETYVTGESQTVIERFKQLTQQLGEK